MVDGNSNDSTVSKCQEYSSLLPSLTIIASPRRHVCTQRNLGAKAARADILVFMDADNRLPNYFLQGIKYRWESSDADILSTWLKSDISKPSNETIATAINLFLELQNNIKPSFLLESMIVITKSCFNACHGFDESTNYAEGKSLIRTAVSLGFIPKIVRDPVYIYSFRRLRKYGAIGMTSRIARIELASLLGLDPNNSKLSQLYPMLGGKFFSKPPRNKNRFLKSITKLLQDF